MIILGIILLIYVLSVIGAYNYIRVAFSDGGVYHYSDLDSEVFLVFLVPLMNTFFSIVWLLGGQKKIAIS